MTLMKHDGFAIVPKRCTKCGRLFWLEFYDTSVSLVGIGLITYTMIKCKECKDKECKRQEKGE